MSPNKDDNGTNVTLDRQKVCIIVNWVSSYTYFTEILQLTIKTNQSIQSSSGMSLST